MKNFFATMNFVRAVMVVCFLGALVLGYMSKEAMVHKATLQEQVVGDNALAGRVANRIQQLAVELDQLQKVSAGFSYEELQNAGEYARTMAGRTDVALGFVDVASPSEKSNVAGSTDKTWSLSPKDPKLGRPRGNISNYFYILEVENPFVVVTKASFIPIDKAKDDEYGSDRWTWKADITSRLPAE